MKKFYLACLVLLLPHLMQAQTSTCASDTLLFRECFSDSILKTDIELMRKVYNNILGGPRVNREYYLGLEYLEPVVIGRIYSDRGFWLPSSISHIIKTTNLDKTLRNFKISKNNIHAIGMQKKQRLFWSDACNTLIRYPPTNLCSFLPFTPIMGETSQNMWMRYTILPSWETRKRCATLCESPPPLPFRTTSATNSPSAWHSTSNGLHKYGTERWRKNEYLTFNLS